MVMKFLLVVLLIVVIAFFINGIEDYNRRMKAISFRESFDLTGLPVVTFINNGNKFNFLLDTGASLSIIDSNIVDKLKNTPTEGKGTVFGMEGNKVDVTYTDIILEYKNKKFTENFQIVDMKTAFDGVKKETGVTVHGILGSSFLQNNKYVLDFKELIAYNKK